MGGDHGPAIVAPAALEALRRYPELHLILVGDEGEMRSALESAAPPLAERFTLRHTTQKVEMHEKPSSALRLKREIGRAHV